MTDNSQAAHEAAMKAAWDAVFRVDDCSPDASADRELCIAYLAHLRPAIEAQAREAALREAAEAIDCGCSVRSRPSRNATCNYHDCPNALAGRILALIQKEPTNAG